MLLSDTRKPLDNFISGAIFSCAIVALREKSVKKITKVALQSGVASSLAISASNNIANKNYTNAAICATGAIFSVLAIENLFKDERKNNG